MASSSQQMVTNIIDRSRTLINNDLKTILREEGLQVTGNKAALQSRIHTRTSPSCGACASAHLTLVQMSPASPAVAT